MVTAVPVAREVPADPPLEATRDGIIAFGHALHGQVGEPGDNTVLSPLSVAYAFAMARGGAVGTTAAEIDNVLRFPEQGVHAAFNALDRAIVTQGGPPPQLSPSETRSALAGPQPPVVAIANGLFVQHQFEVRRAFLETLAANYGAGIGRVDFTNPPAAKQTLDAWVRKHTAGRIQELFSHLDPTTRLVLANAIYLKADWESPFPQHDTETTTFTRTGGSQVQVPLMHDRSRRRYATGDGWKAVELIYAGGELAMWVILPDDPTRVLDSTSPQLYKQLAERLTEGEVEIFLPRFDFATDIGLVPVLQALGMQTPFRPDADFSAMSPEPLFIRDAIQRANITVDEYGTEAAAVTGLAFAVSEPPPPELTLRADRPFAFMVSHLPTDTPVFIGHVADPSTTSG
ncbi:MAG: serpin family protein [Actinomycetota bacterium]|nr:serpin family protein [Actinomycetota bacterium]